MGVDQQESILADPELAAEAAAALGTPPAARGAGPGDAPPAGPAARAIVRRLGRPSLLVRNDTFEVPASSTWRARLDPTRSRLEAAVRSVGRVEVAGLGGTHLGTAWMVAAGVAVTNRHVALEFARRRGREFAFRPGPGGSPLRPRIDFREEAAATRPFEVAVARVLHVAGLDDDGPDVALLEVHPPAGRALPAPIPLAEGEPEAGRTVAVVGYPAHDPRNPEADQDRLFAGLYDVKRLAPGEVVAVLDGGVFTHDATTLGGSSGSVVVDVATGAALGLHFAGRYLEANYAVSAPVLRRLLRRVRRPAPSPPPRPPAPPEGRVDPAALEGRAGFAEDFLGPGPLRVPLPSLGRGVAPMAVVVDAAARGTRRFALPYAHFSVVTHGPRRSALFTAVNIDGARARRVKRAADRWSFDPRIDEGVQAGNAVYAGNDLDRGHLVRRLDPAWGDEAEAATAEADTFFYTNSSPQHARFNQHLWLSLEDHVLDSAATLGLRASVFTGPVLDPGDRLYRGVGLPRAFWKVAVAVHARGGLSATGYLVSQADLVSGIEFVFGQFRTWQVPVRRIEALTGLRFGSLAGADPLGDLEGTAAVELTGADGITL